MKNIAQQPETDLTTMGNNDQRITPRNPLFAAVMSAILPGFGQLYNGQVNKSLWIFIAFCLIALPLAVIIALYLPVWMTVFALAAGVIIPIMIWVYGIIDAWRNARNWQTIN